MPVMIVMHTHLVSKHMQEQDGFNHILKFSLFLGFEICLNDLVISLATTRFGHPCFFFFDLFFNVFKDGYFHEQTVGKLNYEARS